MAWHNMGTMTDQITYKIISTKEQLLIDIEIFLANNPCMSPEGFGWNACRQSALVDRLRKGGDTTTNNLDKVYDFIANPRASRKSYAMKRSNPTKSE